MKLLFDGSAAQYHPATGLTLQPGEAEYPDDKAAELLATGLVRKPAEGKRAKKAEE